MLREIERFLQNPTRSPLVLPLLLCVLLAAGCDKPSAASSPKEPAEAEVAGSKELKNDQEQAGDGAKKPDPPSSEADAEVGDAANEELVVEETGCQPFSDSKKTGTFKSKMIDESSGLAASRKYPGYLWTHNDSGDEARIFLVHPDGTLVAEVKYPGIDAVDWEDMAIGPCEAGGESECIYVGDTGDNLKKRDLVAVHKIKEPTLPDGHLTEDISAQESVVLNADEVHQIWFNYPEGPRDVETLMVHPKTAEIYLVEKNTTPDAPVFRVPGTATTPEKPASAEQIGSLYLANLSGLVAMVTAGDFSPDGREFMIRTYLEGFIYCLPEAVASPSFEELIEAEPVRSFMPLMIQGEALAYDLDGRSIWLSSEGVNAPIIRGARPTRD